MVSDVERIAKLEAMVGAHEKAIDSMTSAVTQLSTSVTELVTTYKNKERNSMILGGLICAVIGAIPSIVQLFNSTAQAAQ